MVDGLYHEVVARLKMAGFVFHREGKGSHEFWKCSETGKLVMVATTLKSRHLANKILKSAGLPRIN